MHFRYVTKEKIEYLLTDVTTSTGNTLSGSRAPLAQLKKKTKEVQLLIFATKNLAWQYQRRDQPNFITLHIHQGSNESSVIKSNMFVSYT